MVVGEFLNGGYHIFTKEESLYIFEVIDVANFSQFIITYIKLLKFWQHIQSLNLPESISVFIVYYLLRLSDVKLGQPRMVTIFSILQEHTLNSCKSGVLSRTSNTLI